MVSYLKKKKKTGARPTPDPQKGAVSFEKINKGLFQPSFLFPFLLLVLVFLVYMPSLPNGFVSDDHFRIDKNPALYNFSNIVKVFNPKTYNQTAVEPTFRPVVVVFRFFNCAIWGNWPPGHRLNNILFHLLNVLLFYFLALKLLKQRVLAGLSALLFGIHPLISEAVMMVSLIADVFAGFFVLASILLYLNFREAMHKPFLYWVSVLCYLLAMLSKEIAIMAVFAIITIDLFSIKRAEGEKFGINHLLRYGGFFCAAILFYVLRFKIFLPSAEYYAASYYTPTIFATIATTSRLIVYSLGKFLFPLHLSALDSFARSTTLDGQGLLALGLTLLLITGFILAFRKNKLAFLGLFWFFLFLFPLLQLIPTFLPFFERWVYIPMMGLALACGALLLWLIRLPDFNEKHRKKIIIVISIFFMLLSARTIARSFDWKDDVTLWNSALTVDQNNVRVLLMLSSHYQREKDFPQMLLVLKRVERLEPNNPDVFAGLASYYYQTGDYKRVIDYSKLALKYGPVPQHKISVETRFLEPYKQDLINEQIFTAYLKLNQSSEAKLIGKQIIRKTPRPYVLFHLARLYESTAEPAVAVELYQKTFDILTGYIQRSDLVELEYYLLYAETALKLNKSTATLPFLERAYKEYPSNMALRSHLATAYRLSGKPKLAARLEETIIRLDVDSLLAWGRRQLPRPQFIPSPAAVELLESIKIRYQDNLPGSIPALKDALVRFSWDQLYLELGAVYAQLGRKQTAVETWAGGIRLNPYNPFFYAHMGYLFAELGDRESAIKLWERALELKPDFEELREMMKE